MKRSVQGFVVAGGPREGVYPPSGGSRPGSASDWVVSTTKDHRRRTVYNNVRTGESTYFKPDVLKTPLELARAHTAGGLDALLKARREEAFAAGRNSVYARPTQSLDPTIVVATEDTPLPESNVGHRLLRRMGWRVGTGLGRHGTGRVEPVRAIGNIGSMGLGKAAQEEAKLEEAAKTRRTLDIELEAKNAPEVQERIEAKQAKAAATKQVLAKQNRPFYCEVCDKQYTSTMEMQRHLQSYDHGHRVRFKEMKEMERARNAALHGDSKRRKEQRREARELKRRMKQAREAEAAAAARSAARAPAAGNASTRQPVASSLARAEARRAGGLEARWQRLRGGSGLRRCAGQRVRVLVSPLRSQRGHQPHRQPSSERRQLHPRPTQGQPAAEAPVPPPLTRSPVLRGPPASRLRLAVAVAVGVRPKGPGLDGVVGARHLLALTAQP